MAAIKEFLINNNGKLLLNDNYPCTAYYNKYSINANEEVKYALLRLMKMQVYEPIQYMLSIKALLDN